MFLTNRRACGKVSPIKDQGQCGSCWTFSTTGNIESVWAIAGHRMTLLSEQQLVDCVNEGANAGGCNGGWMGESVLLPSFAHSVPAL